MNDLTGWKDITIKLTKRTEKERLWTAMYPDTPCPEESPDAWQLIGQAYGILPRLNMDLEQVMNDE